MNWSFFSHCDLYPVIWAVSQDAQQLDCIRNVAEEYGCKLYLFDKLDDLNRQYFFSPYSVVWISEDYYQLLMDEHEKSVKDASVRDVKHVRLLEHVDHFDVLREPVFLPYIRNKVNHLLQFTRDRRVDLFFNKITRSMPDGLMITDDELKILEVNKAFTDVTGYSFDEVVGQTPRLLHSGKQSKLFYEEMWHDIELHGYWEGEVCNRRKNGELYTEWLAISRARDDFTGLEYYIGIFSDISKIKLQEQQLIRHAYYDPLTGLCNRTLFFERLADSIEQAERLNKTGAILFIDLDGFKPINDQYGHVIGDQVLKEVSQNLLASVRTTDIVSRIGGDEFVVMLNFIENETGAEIVARKIIDQVSRTIVLGDKNLTIGCSIGVTTYNSADVKARDLLLAADDAMYTAKRGGGNQFRINNRAMPQQNESNKAHA